MKPLGLTEEQKEKLLEMCNKLFPEYKFSWEYDMYGRALKQDFNDVLCIFTKEKAFNIHWFEFCMIWLVVKLRSFSKIQEHTPTQLMDFYNFYWDVSNYRMTQVHPVDYLYEQFKKIK